MMSFSPNSKTEAKTILIIKQVILWNSWGWFQNITKDRANLNSAAGGDEIVPYDREDPNVLPWQTEPEAGVSCQIGLGGQM